MVDHVGQQFGNYHLVRLVGHGGFADVYQGEHLFLKTTAAIKVLNMRLSNATFETFLNEARTLARLEHPHIIRILEGGIGEGQVPFLVMYYAPHGTLRQRHPRGSRLPLLLVVSYVRQVAEALQYAHDHKLIHRDIKPENMLVGLQGDVLLSDFGLVTTTHSTGSQSVDKMAGTIHYTAPEQIQGKPRLASDQYALGVVAYEWLSGTLPFIGSLAEIVGQHLTAPPQPLSGRIPGLSRDIEQVILTALAKNPAERFPHVKAFADALEKASHSALDQSTNIRFTYPSTIESIQSDFIISPSPESQFIQLTALQPLTVPSPPPTLTPSSGSIPQTLSITPLSMSTHLPNQKDLSPDRQLEISILSHQPTSTGDYSSDIGGTQRYQSSAALPSRKTPHRGKIIALLLILLGLLFLNAAIIVFLLTLQRIIFSP